MEKLKKIIKDFLFGSAGLLWMNGVLSLIVYPFISELFGAAGQGKILFFMAIASLMAGSFGSGAAYVRLKIYSEEQRTVNGEYNVFLLLSAAVLLIVTGLSVFLKGESAGAGYFGIFAVILATTIRTYADVEYRLSLKYGAFSLYYMIIGTGYLLGILFCRLTGAWVLIFLTGELSGLLFVIFRGSIFRRPFFERTPAFKKHLRGMFALSGSFLLSDFVSAADRLLFPLLLTNGDEMTAIYYYASLLGKMMSLISTPLNGVLSGHISREKGGMKKKSFLKLVLFMLLIWVLVTAVSVAGSYIFVRLFYRDYLEEARPLFILANAGQVIFFICNTMMVVVLRYTKMRNQIIVSAVYIAAFFLITVPLILKFGTFGMALGIFIVNTLKFVLFTVLGLLGLGKDASHEEEQ